jgi:transmembrane 9 superfamily protein 2/4
MNLNLNPSVRHESQTCGHFKKNNNHLQVKPGGSISYSYAVKWTKSDTIWEKRWDRMLIETGSEKHWVTMIKSSVLMAAVSLVAGVILLRALNHDLYIYNNDEIKEDPDEISGWKMVHGDVFRPPRRTGTFAAIVGTGLQFLLATGACLVLSFFGFINPSYQGGLLSFLLFSFTFFGLISGYYTSRLFKAFRGRSYRRHAFTTASLFPGIFFLIVLVVNSVIASENSSRSIPFSTLASLIALWFCAAVPLSLFGAYFGYKKQAMDFPVRTNQIPRQIPDQKWYTKTPIV